MVVDGIAVKFAPIVPFKSPHQLLAKGLIQIWGVFTLVFCLLIIFNSSIRPLAAIQPGEYTHPILIQHFPLYRPNETVCEAGISEAMPEEERGNPYKPGTDCLTDAVTKQVFNSISPLFERIP